MQKIAPLYIPQNERLDVTTNLSSNMSGSRKLIRTFLYVYSQSPDCRQETDSSIRVRLNKQISRCHAVRIDQVAINWTNNTSIRIDSPIFITSDICPTGSFGARFSGYSGPILAMVPPSSSGVNPSLNMQTWQNYSPYNTVWFPNPQDISEIQFSLRNSDMTPLVGFSTVPYWIELTFSVESDTVETLNF